MPVESVAYWEVREKLSEGKYPRGLFNRRTCKCSGFLCSFPQRGQLRSLENAVVGSLDVAFKREGDHRVLKVWSIS
jgi:hypothetical protein